MTQSVDTASELSLPSPKERRRLRESGDLTPDEVAASLGVTAATVRSWETGRSEPRGRKREAYAKLLAGLDPSEAAPEPAELTERQLTGPHPEPAAGHSDGPQHPPADDPAPEAGPPGPEPEAAAEAGPDDRPAAPGAHHDAPAAPGRGRPPVPPKGGSPSTRPRPAAKRAAKPPTLVARHNPPRQELLAGARPAPSVRARAEGGESPAAARPAARPTPSATPPEPTAPDVEGTLQATPATADVDVDGTAPESAPPAGERAPGDAARTAPDEAPHEGPGEVPEQAPGPALTPAQAFDALYAFTAGPLTRQAYLLTGRHTLAREAVERAFQQAWAQWPEVAADRDPVGWVRAAAYEYALSPWHRLRRAHKHPDRPPAAPDDRALMDALLALEPRYRRTVLLYDGVGLDLPDTAAETEASTPVAGQRLVRAHAELTGRVPELAAPGLLHDRLGAVVPAAPLEPRPAAFVRSVAEHRARRWTRAALGLTVLIALATAYTTATAPRKYEPVESPGASVSGVPPHGGPQRLTVQDELLRQKLRSAPAPGPERLVPRTG